MPGMMTPLGLRITQRIARSRRDVFLRTNFSEFGGYDQVGHALGALVRQGKLLRINQGCNQGRSNLASMVAQSPEGTLHAESKTQAAWDRDAARQGREAGRTTQVPTSRVVAVRKRVRRKIDYNWDNGNSLAATESAGWGDEATRHRST